MRYPTLVLGVVKSDTTLTVVGSLNKEFSNFYNNCSTLESEKDVYVWLIEAVKEALATFKGLQKVLPRRVIVYRLFDQASNFNLEAALISQVVTSV